MGLVTPVPKDTSTLLNVGVGGDTMDESSITQVATGTVAKRARIAVGGDDGSLQTFTTVDNRVEADVGDKDTHDLLQQMLFTMQTMLGVIRLMSDELGIDVPNDAAAEIGDQD